ncbi:MAG TPA: hypothetical protein VLS89_19085, partial [Candidatus Nanopelagicales bacterium]|nr:hypothetical protein [Candidatus Nanopelagicales bacterium]
MDPGSRVEDRFERMRFAGAGGAALLALGFTTLLGAGCVSLNQRLRLLGAQNTPCGELLAGHPALVAEEGYAKEPQPLRENYEGRVAHCHLVSGDHDAALELAARWSDDFDEKLRITAIAAARRGDEGACQAALQRFSSRSSRDVGDIGRFLLETRSFQPFRSRDWFVDLAIRAWAAEPTMDLDEFVSALVRAGGPRLVTLHLATADADLRPGGWALWVGVARGSRIDRENNQTLVYAEGVDITRELVAIDKDITSLEVEEKPSSSSSSRRYEYDA